MQTLHPTADNVADNPFNLTTSILYAEDERGRVEPTVAFTNCRFKSDTHGHLHHLAACSGFVYRPAVPPNPRLERVTNTR